MMSIPMRFELLTRVQITIIAPIALIAGCSGGSDGGSSNSADAPSDTTSAGIAAFVGAGSYLIPPWKSESAAPRDAATSVSPHGRVRVWLDRVAAASTSVADITPDAMAVKEMYDTADQLVGRAAIVQTTSSNNDVVYWCYGPAGRCGDGEPEYTADAPLYGVGAAATTCQGCHGGLLFTKLH